jgi:hypothetical protein
LTNPFFFLLQRLDARLLLANFLGVLFQRAFLANKPDHILAQTFCFRPNAFGADGAQFAEIGGIQSFRRIGTGENHGLDLFDQFPADMIVRA